MEGVGYATLMGHQNQNRDYPSTASGGAGLADGPRGDRCGRGAPVGVSTVLAFRWISVGVSVLSSACLPACLHACLLECCRRWLALPVYHAA